MVLGGGHACETMRWTASMVPELVEESDDPLSVYYYFQRYNRHQRGSTCGLTSATMLLRYWGNNVTPDSLYVAYGKSHGQSPPALESLYEKHGLYATSTYGATESAIKAHIRAGRPVVVHGYFTGSGHIILIIGYDATGWIVNDPAGRWAGCAECGYPNRTSTNGRGAHYSHSSVRSAIGYSGSIWMSVADSSPL